MSEAASICGLCSQTFSDISHLLLHIQTCHTICPPDCLTCGHAQLTIMSPTHFCIRCSLSPAPPIYDIPSSTRRVVNLEEELQAFGLSTDSFMDGLGNEKNDLVHNAQLETEGQYVDMSEKRQAPSLPKNYNPGYVTAVENPMYQFSCEDTAILQTPSLIPSFGEAFNKPDQYQTTSFGIKSSPESTGSTIYETIPTHSNAWELPDDIPPQVPLQNPPLSTSSWTVTRRVKELLQGAVSTPKVFKREPGLSSARLLEKYTSEAASCACSYCNKQLKNGIALYNHVQNVHGGYKYSCPLCDIKYCYESSVRRHMSNKHPELFEKRKGLVFNILKMMRYKNDMTTDKS